MSSHPHIAQSIFIPSAADRASVQRVVSKFLKLQGSDLNVGLVFREFIEFEEVGRHRRTEGVAVQPSFKGLRSECSAEVISSTYRP